MQKLCVVNEHKAYLEHKCTINFILYTHLHTC